MKILAFWDLWTKPKIQLSVVDEVLMWGSVAFCILFLFLLFLLVMKIIEKRRK